MVFYPPPSKAPTALLKTKNAYAEWLKLYKKFPKPERFGLGEKIDFIFLEILELAFTIRYASPDKRLYLLNKIIDCVDKVKFFSEVAWENKLITAEQHGQQIKCLETIGREFGGWKKGFEKQTPTVEMRDEK